MLNDFSTGFYLPYETVNSNNTIGSIVTRLVNAGINTIWITNGPTDLHSISTLVNICNTNGIKVILGSGKWYILDSMNPNDDIVENKFQTIKDIWNGLSIEDRPFAFAISDEPVSSLNFVAKLADKCNNSNIPVTFVVNNAASNQASVINAPFYALDYYGFFAAGLDSNPPQGDAALLAYHRVMKNISGNICMPQAFQSWHGPAKYDINGYDIVLLPGAKQYWRFPTVEELKWQVNSSVVLGANGCLMFAYGAAGEFVPNPSLPPVLNGIIKTVRTYAPATLVSFPQYLSGEHLDAVVTEFKNIKNCNLKNVKYISDLGINSPKAGDKASLISVNNKRYIAIVASPYYKERNITIQTFSFVKKVVGNSPKPFWFFSLSVKLKPGQLGLYEIF